MENMDDSRLQMYCREAMHCATTNQHLWLSAKKKWDTKEDKGKSMMHALYVQGVYCGTPKGMSRDEVMSNSEQI